MKTKVYMMVGPKESNLELKRDDYVNKPSSASHRKGAPDVADLAIWEDDSF